LILSTDECYRECGDKNIVYVDYENIVDLPIDTKIFIDSGLISVRVVDKGVNYLTTGQYGELYSHVHIYNYR
jgi:pyruvate kinase